VADACGRFRPALGEATPFGSRLALLVIVNRHFGIGFPPAPLKPPATTPQKERFLPSISLPILVSIPGRSPSGNPRSPAMLRPRKPKANVVSPICQRLEGLSVGALVFRVFRLAVTFPS
jgi:hypothetical protein